MGEWYYTTNNQQMGPVSWDELRQLASTGLLHPTDVVGKKAWRTGSRQRGPMDCSASVRPRVVRNRSTTSRGTARGNVSDRDDYDDRPRRRRRSAEGMPLGAKVAIIGGSIAVGLLIVVVIIVLLVRGGSATRLDSSTSIPVRNTINSCISMPVKE